MAKQVSCQQFTDFLIRRAPHYDLDILRDVTPNRGWIGQVPTGNWGAFEGTTKIGHRIRRMYPDLSGCWKTVIEDGCIGTPCDPDRKKVGFGYDQFQYHLEEIFYETDVFCFPLIMSADAAKEQFAALIDGLREATVLIWNHHYRTEAIRVAGRKVLTGALFVNANPVWNSDCTRMTVAAEPTSKLTIQFLQRYVDILTSVGYLGQDPLATGMMFELITDAITSSDLRENNPALKDYLRVGSVDEFTRLYKYGVTGSIGNFLLHIDPEPLRYQKISATEYQLVFPYTNSPAAGGIGADENQAYINASYQWDLIWHRGVMRSLVRRSAPINSQMPFPSRDFGGRWQFVQDNMTCRDSDGNIIPIDNVERTKGKFIANFSAGTKPEHPEWAVAFFSLRGLSCVVDVAPCQDPQDYVEQDYSSVNPPCPKAEVNYDIAGTGPWTVTYARCNDVEVTDPSDAFDTVADLLTYLNGTLGAYGTWSNPAPGVIRLTDSTCDFFDINISSNGV